MIVISKKILITGGDGQLGSEITYFFSKIREFKTISMTRKDIDITKPKSVEKIKKYKPDIIIHTAAYTNVEQCEINPEIAFNTNTIGTYYLVKIAKNLNSLFLYISTDYVFKGDKKRPYSEKDKPNPINIYGISKYNGEILVDNYLEKKYIIRISYLFGLNSLKSKKGKGNFIDFVIKNINSNRKIRLIKDNKISLTYTKDVVESIYKILKYKLPYGLYHITNRKNGFSSYDFAKKIISIYNPEKKYLLQPIKYNEYESVVSRPKYSVLSTRKIETYNIFTRTIDDALKEYIQEKYLK